eukprot:CAMPEP_0113512678 /NCGR_PEP_ID=MMETSP0014_2-20120614/39462_1 /TAXON_ID=2857 /ORGANISM="Nitzschia sp." /LENGTH=545 /DNA_ID=CAMNT_0000409041 /DNA_START=25 /DNA_END=1659 /DNA_ORIENTATION=- /assembly_acc=CAM_ASM_000159
MKMADKESQSESSRSTSILLSLRSWLVSFFFSSSSSNAATTSATTSATTTTTTTPPKPYSIWFHPYLSWADTLVSLIVGWLLDFTKLLQASPTSEEAVLHVKNMRQSMTKQDLPMIQQAVQSWKKHASTSASSPTNHHNDNAARKEQGEVEIVECSYEIPVQHDILEKWDVLTKEEELHLRSRTSPSRGRRRETVNVLVRFPSTLLLFTQEGQQQRKADTSEKSESGCVLLLDANGFDLKSFVNNVSQQQRQHSKVQVLVQFHGGGLTIGDANKSQLVNEVAQLTAMAGSSSGDLISISVNYGLAPDAPWPIGIIDTLSVIDYLLDDTPSTTNIHLSGESAGAHFALVGGIEACRRYNNNNNSDNSFKGQQQQQNRIKSVQLQSPMIDPAGDTVSYYMNQNVFPSGKWLRWCWRSYLSIDGPVDTYVFAHNNETTADMDDVLRDGSNYTQWNKWKQLNGPKSSRLVYPINDIPNMCDDGRSSKISSPMFLITTNKGDPLHDEGVHFVEALKDAGASVEHFEMNGIHCSVADSPTSKPMKERYDVW